MPYSLLTPDFTNTTSRQAEYPSRAIALLNREVIHTFQLSAAELRVLFSGGCVLQLHGMAVSCGEENWRNTAVG